MEDMLRQAMEAVARSTAAAATASEAAHVAQQSVQGQPELLQRVALATEAAAAAATAATAGQRPNAGQLEADPRALRRPAVFNKGSREEEAAGLSDWKRVFLNFVIGHHPDYLDELRAVAADRASTLALDEMQEGAIDEPMCYTVTLQLTLRGDWVDSFRSTRAIAMDMLRGSGYSMSWSQLTRIVVWCCWKC